MKKKGLSVLAPGGRFLEMGKRDIFADNPLGMRALRKNASFHVIDLARIGYDDPTAIIEAYDAVIDLLERKVSRLARALEGTEKERDEARQRAHDLETKGVVVQGRNVMEPGLDEGDPFKGEKLALLRELVLDNQSLRDQIEAKQAASDPGEAPEDPVTPPAEITQESNPPQVGDAEQVMTTPVDRLESEANK